MKRDQTKRPAQSSAATATKSNPNTGGSGTQRSERGAHQEAAQDAIVLLTQDHERVQKMFKEYEELGDKAHASKQKLAQQICEELTIHTRLEEEIFYPAAREAMDDDDLMDEADVEHAAAKELIAQIEGMDSDESHYDAKVKVLSEEVEHHVKEEQQEMFAKVKKTKLDLQQLGAEMAERKRQLRADYAGV